MKKLATIGLLISLVVPSDYIKAISVKEIVSKAWNKVTFKKEKKETVKFHKKVPPHTKVSIHNINGPISIDTWDKNEIIIEVEKEGLEKRFENTQITEKMTDSVYTLTTKCESDNEKTCTVVYTALIPKNAVLFSVTSEHGDIIINNCSNGISATAQTGTIKTYRCCGDIKLHTHHGNIVINHMSSTNKDSLVLSCDYGTIDIAVPKTFNSAHIHASTPHGKINSSIPITTTITTELNRKAISKISKKINGTLGTQETKDKANLKLQVERGNVNITVIS